jgi:dTDP-glucose 4,6-dehydratase
VTISNCSNNYGPYHFPEKLIPLAITNLLEGKSVPVYGDGLQVRDWLYVEDHCRAIDMIIHHGKLGETYCIGGNAETENIVIVQKLLALLGKDESSIEYVKDRAGHDRRYAINFTKIKNELGWEPTVTLEEGLAKTVEWFKENEAWWKNVKSGEYQKYYSEQYEKR